MRVAISTDQGYVSAHFGRCQSYTIFEVENDQLKSRVEIANPGHQPGFLPEYLSEKGVGCIIAGGMGPRAQGLFAQKNIQTILGVQGPIDEIIDKFITRKLEAGDDLCGHQHESEEHVPCDHSGEKSHTSPGKRICITSQGKDLVSEIDPRLGRAKYFIIVDPDTMEFEAVENPNIEADHGAGIQTAQLIASKNVAAVLTGNCGPNAERVLQASGIEVITDVNGTIEDALFYYKSKGN